ncbi:MAG: pantetheine-phosphate adenylyltransferase [Fulvimarina manganoxydans]|uniref:pantetheine-phosphate adenylyltransferase n=1 Tax=Fulvimarina manganoxydans TaxID=937218 RepID=UPI002357DBBB|nr:pantetheine-phosphate adenylyltransferase [Fulvimarina manganoxydans]MCK5933186.1 pantetheine-phosphate adenylyltransferase [Fulvimarina manganoxydans]
MTLAFYPGSFDPVTNGHLDILRQSLIAFERVVVGIGVHASKTAMFSFDERVALIRDALTAEAAARVDVVPFDGLVVEAAAQAGASVLIRGLRDGTDLDYEMQMAGMNGVMKPQIATIFFPASPATRPITATLVRQIAKMGGDVTPFVPKPVAVALADRRA